MANADCIVIEGSNMAECHPVGFQWVMEAKRRGAKVFHVDPRFTRTSAVADSWLAIRAGSDIAFLGGLINYVLTNERDFRDYVVAYTNASTIVGEDFADTEDLGGVFSGFDPETRSYDQASWQYEGGVAPAAAGKREQPTSKGDHSASRGEQHGSGGAGIGIAHADVKRDPTLSDPRCVYQVLKRHFSRYTPEMVEEVCGITPAQFHEVAEAICANSGRERTTAFIYSVGWTHHTVGVQYIRTASILQLLLGNIGRPGGGVLALRGHASIQGSTDIPTLYNLLPGYLPMPHAGVDDDLADYIDNNSADAGFWGHMDAYTVSLLRAWWGDAATAGNDWCWDYLPRITGDHSTYQSVLGMIDGWCKGYFVVGENPATGTANGRLQRAGLVNLDWLVVRDMTEIETAAFWHDSPEIESGEIRSADIGTEVFFLPAAAHTEKNGSFTNTARMLQWHHKAVEPGGDARSDLWFYFHLGRIIRGKLSAAPGAPADRDRPLLDLTWDYPTEGPLNEPSAEAVLAEINGFGPDGPLSSYTAMRADGSTSGGCWIYTGVYADGVNQAARRKPTWEQTWVAPEWGWAWPANRRILYNRASADPDGRPWSERKRYLWWDEGEGKWVGEDVADFKATMRPDYQPPDGATAEDALPGTAPFVMQADGMGWLYAPNGLVDGPMPTHYEPHESPVANPLYAQQASPTRQIFERKDNPSNPPTSPEYPYVFTTYRLTEHHTAGGMSRTLEYLSELQPEFFIEVSPDLAAERGLVNAGWATVVTARSAVEARVLVTERMQPLRVGGRVVHQVGVPYHWGWRGLSVGDAGNDLLVAALDANVHIPEAKVGTCDVVAGRRPRGPGLRGMVEAKAARARPAPEADSTGERGAGG